MKNIITILFRLLLDQYFNQKIRTGTIKAVRGYIQLVQVVRQVTMGVAGLSALVSISVMGVLLMVAGLLALLPVSIDKAPWALFGGGLLLSLIGFIALRIVFKEANWLKASKSYELLDAVTAPTPPLETLTGLKAAVTSPKTSQDIVEPRPQVRLEASPVGAG